VCKEENWESDSKLFCYSISLPVFWYESVFRCTPEGTPEGCDLVLEGDFPEKLRDGSAYEGYVELRKWR